MDRDNLRQILADQAKRFTGEAPPELQDGDMLLQKVKLDSFSFVSLVIDLEEKFDITLPDAEVQAVTTVGSLLDLILRKMEKSEPAATLPLKPAATETPAQAGTLRASVRTVGYVDVPIGELGALRESLAVKGRSPYAQSVVRLCDEQTVLGVAAVADAMRRASMTAEETSMWGIVASSRFLGRRTSINAYQRCNAVGPSRMSPLLIPFVSLHAGANVLSVYYGCHGPTYGVSGCADNVTEGVMNGLTVPLSAETPGAWLVFTAWEPEPVCNNKGETETPSRGYAVALGLTESSAQAPMRMVYSEPKDFAASGEMPSMQQLTEAVARLDSAPCKFPLSTGGTLLIERLAQASRLAA